MTKRLVTVRKVVAVHLIKGADRIEAVEVDGSTCVTGIGQFNAGAWPFSSRPTAPCRRATRGGHAWRRSSSRTTASGILAAWVDLEIRHGRHEVERLLCQTAFEGLLGVKMFEATATTGGPARKSGQISML
ncbi:hypothetical protein DL771_008834 [Monosporascus sp. 5C6A]|nr:hypothetical protein DL771_008834 [Monosporascus sp. 5C6A]